MTNDALRTTRTLLTTLTTLVAITLAACDGTGGASGPGAPGSSPPDSGLTAGSPTPAWLAGSYAHDAGLDNNIPRSTDSRELRLDASGSYAYKTCKTCDSKGTWKVSGDALVFDGGSLSGKQLTLRTSMSQNCRVLDVDGKKLARPDVVDGCPLGDAPVRGDGCKVVGTYAKNSQSGSSDNGTSESEIVQLDADHFFRRTTSHSSFRCYGTTCKSLTSSTGEQVGTWTLSGGKPSIPGVSLEGFSFTPGECEGAKGAPGDSSPDLGGGGGTASAPSAPGTSTPPPPPPPACTSSGHGCDAGADCCSGVCVSTGSQNVCADRCTSNAGCSSGCCAPLESGGAVCAPAEYCAPAPSNSCFDGGSEHGTCDACQQAEMTAGCCKYEYDACGASSACVSLSGCIADCPAGSSACVETCANKHSSGVTSLVALYDCLYGADGAKGACSSVCQ